MLQTVSGFIFTEREFQICDHKLLRLLVPYFELLQLFSHDLCVMRKFSCEKYRACI